MSETKENVKRQLTEAKNEMTIQMNAVKESGFSLCSIIKQKPTETKNEVLDEMSNQRESTKLILSESEKRITGMESYVQTHFTNLENQLKETKQEIVAETEENFRLQITEAKNEVLAKINVSSELTKLYFSKHEQLTSEMQSEIRIQIKEVEAILNTSGAFNEINNKVININAQEQTVKEQLAETSKKIIQQMGELGETQIAVISNFTQKLTKTNGMVDEIKALLLNNENLIEKIQSNMQAQFTEAKTEISQLQYLNEVKNQLAKTQEKILTEIQDCKSVPRDCREVQKRGYNTSGIFRIQPMLSLQSFLVWCDLSTREGGWTYVVNRFDGSENFYLNWTDYKQGFGNLSGEYWLGLDHLYELTSKFYFVRKILHSFCFYRLDSKRTELLFELVDWDLKKVYALYDDFQIGNEFEMYRVKTLGKYTGDAGNSFYPHQNANFSTADNEHSGTCAAYFGEFQLYFCRASL